MENSTNLETVASDEMAIEESRRRVTTAVGERNFVSARERRTLENFSDENNSFRAKYSVLVAPSLPRIFEALLRLGPEIMTRVPCFLLPCSFLAPKHSLLKFLRFPYLPSSLV
jgi:hypothetical protein